MFSFDPRFQEWCGVAKENCNGTRASSALSLWNSVPLSAVMVRTRRGWRRTGPDTFSSRNSQVCQVGLSANAT